MKNITAPATIEKCREIVARFGLPVMLVSDNGTTFTSDVFQRFIKENGIIHVRSAPYHPATNGLAERFVQTLKQSLRKRNENDTVEQHIQKFLFSYRTTPLPEYKKSPAELMLGRQIRTRLSLTLPTKRIKIWNETPHKTVRSMEIGDEVLAREYVNKKYKWRKGIIEKKFGKLHYLIRIDENRVWKRHIDQVRKLIKNNSIVSEETQNEMDYENPRENIERPNLDRPNLEVVNERRNFENANQVLQPENGGALQEEAIVNRNVNDHIVVEPNNLENVELRVEPRRSGRRRQEPKRFRDYISFFYGS